MMITKKVTVNHIRVLLYGEPLSEKIKISFTNNTYFGSIPLSFNYNCSWKVEHSCTHCQQNVSFGLHYDSTKSNHPQLSYNKIAYLCSKYFTNSFLEEFPLLFNSTSVKEFQGDFFVISNDIFREEYPVTSSIEPIYYACLNCDTEYLCRFRQGFLIEPDPQYTSGMLGKIFIDEIIQVVTNDNKKVADLVKAHLK